MIREGKKEDLPRVLDLIRELAEFEKAPDQVEMTLEQLEKDGFGKRQLYGLLVAENGRGIIGISLYYFRYSTWKGKRLYLEDIIVTASERGNGAGKMLFDSTVQKAREENCSGMAWQVLDWNKEAITFYEKQGATFDGEWINCALDL